MLTKVLIIVGVSIAIVVAFFLTGYLLDKDTAKKERDAASKETHEKKES